MVCARMLLRSGMDVTVLEAGDGVGGRVRSDIRDGFILDRGFQVLFTAYPAAQRQLDFARLDLRSYEPGAVICRGAARHTLSDPLRDPSTLLDSALTTLIDLQDKVLTVRLTQELKSSSITSLREGPDETTESYLRGYGFSERFLDHFVRPFFGGIFLSTDLQTSAQAFLFYWKMLSEGDTAVPARGMGEIARQLAEELIAQERIRYNTRVESLLHDTSGACVGIQTADGTIAADAVALATPAPEAARLSGQATPQASVGTVTLYFAGDSPVVSGKKILLHANIGTLVNNVAPVTNIAPEQAPTGKHLLSVSLLGIPEGDDASLYDRSLHDLRRMLVGEPAALPALGSYRPLALYRIPYSQFAQPPGTYAGLPDVTTKTPGLYFAGEFVRGSSLNGAMESGERAARMILGHNT